MSVPVSLASWSSLPKCLSFCCMSLLALIAILMLVFRLVILWMESVLFGAVSLICGHVRRPPMTGSASIKVMFGGAFPSLVVLSPLFSIVDQ